MATETYLEDLVHELNGEVVSDGAESEMARRIASHDWTATPLGDIRSWPQSLRSAVDMILGMTGPANIMWGPAHIQIYNDGYIDIAKERHPATLGRSVPENWPEAFVNVLEPRLKAVFAGLSIHQAASRVPLRGAGGLFEERVFETSWSPIRDETGGVAGALEILVEVTERNRAEAGRRESEARLREVLNAMGEGFALLAPDFTILDINPMTLSLDDRLRDDLLGRSHWDAFPGTESTAAGAVLRSVMQERTPAVLEHQYVRPDGRSIWLDMRVYPTSNDGVAIFWRDITDRVAAQERQRTLINELNHRVKNNLALVQAIAVRTFRGRGCDDALKQFVDRLVGLAGTHELLTRNEWASADVSDIIASCRRGLSIPPDRLRVAGPQVRLAPDAAVSLSLAIHELATNAIKYGALSNDLGAVEVTWTLATPTQRLCLTWREKGGPAVEPPTRRGFGAQLLSRIFLSQRGGATTSYEADGLVCMIELSAR